jgi:3-hydroxyethyl bacteriochlorophyllide a dehydrogenase
MKAQAIVFNAPQSLSVQTLEVCDMGPTDVEVEVSYTGISTGTERLLWDGTMPPFPGLAYPLVPGYETVGTVVKAGTGVTNIAVGDTVFVPGSYSFQGVQNIFGGSGSLLVVPQDRVVKVDAALGPKAVLLALAATSYHTFSLGGARQPMVYPDLIIGHGTMGRLLARMVVAAGQPAPVVWETQAVRREGGMGYPVIHPDEDTRKDYRAIYDVSGYGEILNKVIPKMAMGGEVCLAGFYKQELSFAYAPAFMREAQIRVAAQWKKHDLQAVTELVKTGALSLEGLITHTQTPAHAREAYEVAFGDVHCLKMIIDWRKA